MDVAKGLPEELRELTGYHCLNTTKDLKKYLAVVDTDSVLDEITMKNDEGTTMKLKAFVSNHSKALAGLFERRTDLTKFYDSTTLKPDVHAFAAQILDARAKAEKAKRQRQKQVEFNTRSNEYEYRVVKPQCLQYLKPINTADNSFVRRFIAKRRSGSTVDLVFLDEEDHNKIYEIETGRDATYNNLPSKTLEKIGYDLLDLLAAFSNEIKGSAPSDEFESFEAVSWKTAKDKESIKKYCDFVDGLKIERYFDDKWCEAHGRTPYPHILLELCKLVSLVQVTYDDKGHRSCHAIRYEIDFETNEPKKLATVALKAIVEGHFTTYDASSLPERQMHTMTNLGDDLARYYVPKPAEFESKATDNDALIRECLHHLPKTLQKFMMVFWRLDTHRSREMLARLMFYIGMLFDAEALCSQALAIAGPGGVGKTTLVISNIKVALEKRNGSGFCTTQRSGIFLQKFEGRSGCFNSVFCVIDEYDGHSAFEDGSWYKEASGATSRDATLSLTMLNRANIDVDIANLHMAFLNNNENMFLKGDAERRRILPIQMDGLKGSAEDMWMLTKPEYYEPFFEACWHYYTLTALRKKSSSDYFILTDDEYEQFLVDGKVPYDQIKDAARHAFENDSYLRKHYTMIDSADMFGDRDLFEHLFDLCFTLDSDSVVKTSDILKQISEAVLSDDELRSSGAFEFEKGQRLVQTSGKATGWSRFRKWIGRKYGNIDLEAKMDKNTRAWAGLRLKPINSKKSDFIA